MFCLYTCTCKNNKKFEKEEWGSEKRPGLDYSISHGSHSPDLLHVSTTSKADDFITSSRLKLKDEQLTFEVS